MQPHELRVVEPTLAERAVITSVAVERALTTEQILALPATVDVVTAGRCFGIGRGLSYELAARGAFPVPVLRLGRSLRVPRAAILAALGMDGQVAG